jgi:ABC-type sulfate transport system permease component
MAIKNTMTTACVTATASMLLAALIAWYWVRRTTLLARVRSVLSFMPLFLATSLLMLANLIWDQ